ncbi:MAG: glucose-1-phosphate cytidylyltransferase [Candidatus Omnitrophica bacterium]|nr:glucose-1-phosphate cytidylyltransferase [Candidatus Omnitrophota bacterium]
MKVVILCGGQGMRLREETEVKPKPMVEIGGMPILWHIMKTYAHYGFKEFILCLGYKGEVIKNYFYNYEMLTNDFTIELGTKNVDIIPRHAEHGWKVTLVDTGKEAMTGARVKRIEKYITDDTFMLTYGDGVIDLDLNKLVAFHCSHGKCGTVTGVSPQSRYGELTIDGDHVVSFDEKPVQENNFISGGYFVLNRSVFQRLSDQDDCVFEKSALNSLAQEGQLKVYTHQGFWQCVDTFRDYKYLQGLWDNQQAQWKKW